MAYLYRGGPQSPRDDVATTITATFSNSLSSAARNPNRMSAGGMGANTTTTPSSDVRAGLTRRFTTNALPTLSPLGLQRKQAMGDYTVSRKLAHQRHQIENERSGGKGMVDENKSMDNKLFHGAGVAACRPARTIVYQVVLTTMRLLDAGGD